MGAIATGTRIGKYELGKQLGEGGFGVVYIARDIGLDRDVALKFLHPEHTSNVEILQRFLQEARASARIVHSGIVTIYEAGQVEGTKSDLDGTAFIAMELLHGEPLSARLERAGKMPPSIVAEIGRQIASALDAAHSAGVVHRDLKPDNVFLLADPTMPSGERVKILDFGIAKLGKTPNPLKTATGLVFGTPRYMSPEQCRSAANIDHRSDIYTLGVILFELVTGQPVFDGSGGEQIAKHQLVDPPLASSLVTLPPALDALIARMLAKEPQDRPQSMDEVRRALEGEGLAVPGSTLMPNAEASNSGSMLPPTVYPGQTPATGTPVPLRTPTPATAIGKKQALLSSPPSAGQEVPPVSPQTTLSAGAGASLVSPPPRGRIAKIAIGLAVVGLGAATAMFALHSSSSEPTPGPAAAKADAAQADVAALPAIVVDAGEVAAVIDAEVADTTGEVVEIDAAVGRDAGPHHDAGHSHTKLDSLRLIDAGSHTKLDSLRLVDAAPATRHDAPPVDPGPDQRFQTLTPVPIDAPCAPVKDRAVDPFKRDPCTQ